MKSKIMKLFCKHSFSKWVLRGNRHDCDGEWLERKCKKCGKLEQKDWL